VSFANRGPGADSPTSNRKDKKDTGTIEEVEEDVHSDAEGTNNDNRSRRQPSQTSIGSKSDLNKIKKAGTMKLADKSPMDRKRSNMNPSMSKTQSFRSQQSIHLPGKGKLGSRKKSIGSKSKD
jgi:hypothetical protein